MELFRARLGSQRWLGGIRQSNPYAVAALGPEQHDPRGSPGALCRAEHAPTLSGHENAGRAVEPRRAAILAAQSKEVEQQSVEEPSDRERGHPPGFGRRLAPIA